MMLRIIFCATFYCFTVISAPAFSIASWNVAGASVENVADRTDDLAALRKAFLSRDENLPDVLILQEVTSYAAAKSIADGLGYQNATIVTTDVGDDKEIWPFALEIALITTRNVVDVSVLQTVRYNRGKPVPFRKPFIQDQISGKLTRGDVTELVIPSEITASNNEKPSRGLLRVVLEDNLVIYGVHLKSSGLAICRAWQVVSDAYDLQKLAADFGLDDSVKAIQEARDAISDYSKNIPDTGIPATVEETQKSARNREAMAGAIGLLASNDINNLGLSAFVAGDFNTPLVEPCKSGQKLEEDAIPQVGCSRKPVANSCAGTDGFDDTYGILTNGLVGSPKFKTLTKDLGRTYVKSGFADSPIDNILVTGPAANWDYNVSKLEGTKVNNKVFGSDHFAIFAVAK